MKKNVWTWMLAAGMVLAGCSDEMDVPGGETPSATGEGYIKIALNLPSTSGVGTRAEGDEDSNDQFNNGIGAEYNVGEDNYIVFFEGTSESAATFRAAYKLSGLDFSNANQDPSNITTTSSLIHEAPVKTSESNKMYALVVLNANGLISIGEGNTTMTIGKSATAGDNNSITTSSKLSDFYGAVLKLGADESLADFVGSGTNTFLMTNAPIAKLSGSDSNLSLSQDVTTLAEVNVYPTEAEAAATGVTPDPIYVERAVAKVTISAFPETLKPADEENPLNGAAISLTAWTLDNTNKSTKFVRDVTGDNAENPAWKSWVSIANTASTTGLANRFFGTVESPYRVYWAIDNNYSSTNAEDLKSVPDNALADNTWKTTWKDNSSNPVPIYCLENTFTPGTATPEDKATRVLFQVQVVPEIKEDGTSDTKATDFILGQDYSTLYTKTTFLAEVKEHFTAQGEGTPSFELADELNAKTYETAESLYSTDDENKPLFKSGVTEDNADEILEYFGGKILFYKNNIMYYSAASIKHFGEHYTPLVENDDDANYLGRYGVVRNNWYDMNVTKVGIGSPTVPGDEGNLDEEESYINVEINILSWAKREQNVEL